MKRLSFFGESLWSLVTDSKACQLDSLASDVAEKDTEFHNVFISFIIKEFVVIC